MSWKKHNKLTWPGFSSSSSSFSSSFFPVGKLLIPDSDIMSNNLGEALFFCWPTQHTTFLYFFLGMPKKYWGKKNLNISIVGRQQPAFLKFWNAKKQLQKFSKIYRQVKWLPSSRCRYQKQASMRWEKIVSERTRSRKNGSPVCSYNPIQAKKSFLWVTFLRGFQQCVLKSQNKGNKEYKMRSSIFKFLRI